MATDTTRVSSYAQYEGYKDSAGTMYQYASAVNNLVSGLTASANYVALNRVFSGLTASCEASQINNLFSGLASTVTAGMITGYTLRAATADAAATSLAAASATYAVSASTAQAALRATTADAAASASYAASAAYAVTALAATTALAAASATYAASAGTAANATTAVTAAAATTALAAASASYAASAGTLSGVTATAAQLNALLYGTKYKVAFGTVTASNATVMSSVTNCGLSTALYAHITPQATGIIAGAVATQTGVRWIVCNASGTATEVAAYYMVIGNA